MNRISLFVHLTFFAGLLLMHGVHQAQSFQSVIGVATSEVRNIVTDNQNNTYVVGSFFGTHDFDPGPGTVNLTASMTHALFLQKFDSARRVRIRQEITNERFKSATSYG